MRRALLDGEGALLDGEALEGGDDAGRRTRCVNLDEHALDVSANVVDGVECAPLDSRERERTDGRTKERTRTGARDARHLRRVSY